MTEQLLQFIWQFQYFNSNQLEAVGAQHLEIIKCGQLNQNQGPDFLDAAVRFDDTLLVGSIELHLKSSGWNQHGHHEDPNYHNVILHVVWENDLPTATPFVAVLVLKGRVSGLLLQQYRRWMLKDGFIPCGTACTQVDRFVWATWKERLLAERLQRKADQLLSRGNDANYNWEEIAWRLLARNFGVRVNADAFETIAGSIPISLLRKHQHEALVIEALLMGQAGLLEQSFSDAYALQLQKEYRFYKHKHRLQQPVVRLLFLRMRPASFPTIRLVQLAKLLHGGTHFFSRIRSITSLKELQESLSVSAGDYWNTHYRFDEPAAEKIKKLGQSGIDNIIVNTVVPLLFAYGQFHSNQRIKDRALAWLYETKPEKNDVTASWHALNIENKNAADSQALLELKTVYCENKRCLECAIGNQLLNR